MEQLISRGILSGFFEELHDSIELDVAIVGAGPSGLVASAQLALAGFKTALFEAASAPGGGMWGGSYDVSPDYSTTGGSFYPGGGWHSLSLLYKWAIYGKLCGSYLRADTPECSCRL